MPTKSMYVGGILFSSKGHLEGALNEVGEGAVGRAQEAVMASPVLVCERVGEAYLIYVRKLCKEIAEPGAVRLSSDFALWSSIDSSPFVEAGFHINRMPRPSWYLVQTALPQERVEG